MSESSLIVNKIAEIGASLYRKGMIAGTDGNISARINSTEILITASGKAKGALTEQDMVTVNLQGNVISSSGKPSSEVNMHLHLYNKRDDIKACVHAHPPYTTAFAVAGVPLNEHILPEVALFVGDIAFTEFAFPGTNEVAESLDKYIQTHDAFVLKNHGLVTVGRSLTEAFHRQEIVEHFARILFLARQIGSVDQLSECDLKRLRQMRKEFIQDK
ncbi:MAG: class II aldolase/adducin family protein [candidate division Zixibacteria bacterium]|nr:class II aldolase/adducin family protein [candidate division Zixibacteria bacterium]